MPGEHLHHQIRLDHGRVDRVGVDGVDSDAELAELDRESVGQRDQPVLGRRVVAVSWVAFSPADELTTTIEPPLPASIIAGPPVWRPDS